MADINFGIAADMLPMAYMQPGGIAGFDYDVAQALAEELGDRAVVKDVDFVGLIRALEIRKVDVVIAYLDASADRKRSVDFTRPY
ncbi:transporter substrate-binding domain-containing protein [Streptomyces sp. NPDC029216]|uniref:transporter substrate-binding domain-containing protein n=1 Tax=Streptomyces sp. NPDC029216 TaxID=3154701 RepID=UPI0033C31AD9